MPPAYPPSYRSPQHPQPTASPPNPTPARTRTHFKALPALLNPHDRHVRQPAVSSTHLLQLDILDVRPRLLPLHLVCVVECATEILVSPERRCVMISCASLFGPPLTGWRPIEAQAPNFSSAAGDVGGTTMTAECNVCDYVSSKASSSVGGMYAFPPQVGHAGAEACEAGNDEVMSGVRFGVSSQSTIPSTPPTTSDVVHSPSPLPPPFSAQS